MPLCTMVGLGPGNSLLDTESVSNSYYGPSSTPRGAAPLQNFGHVRCGQTTRWIKMPLGTKVGLVLHGDPAPPPKRGTAPNFRLTSIVAERSPISATAEKLLKYSYASCRVMFQFNDVNEP